MKRFRCGDVVPDCSEVLEGASEQEVLAAVDEHARRDHGIALDAETRDQVRARVQVS